MVEMGGNHVVNGWLVGLFSAELTNENFNIRSKLKHRNRKFWLEGRQQANNNHGPTRNEEINECCYSCRVDESKRSEAKREKDPTKDAHRLLLLLLALLETQGPTLVFSSSPFFSSTPLTERGFKHA